METVYGSHDEVHSLSGGTVSDRVQNLASSVYREFEVMMNTYGDGVIGNLMPQVVTILESLNQAYREKQEHEVELELLHVENDNLKVQFEREKQLRQSNEQVDLNRLTLQLFCDVHFVIGPDKNFRNQTAFSFTAYWEILTLTLTKPLKMIAQDSPVFDE